MTFEKARPFAALEIPELEGFFSVGNRQKPAVRRKRKALRFANTGELMVEFARCHVPSR